MKRIATILVTLSLALGLAACSENKSGGAAKASGAALKADYDKIKKLTAAAKTGADFIKITVECGGLEIKAATSGTKLAQDKTYQQVCKVAPTKARAKIAIAESKGGKTSSHCLAVDMNLDDLIKTHPDLKALQGQVKKACDI